MCVGATAMAQVREARGLKKILPQLRTNGFDVVDVVALVK
jgi:hypothetical protein